MAHSSFSLFGYGPLSHLYQLPVHNRLQAYGSPPDDPYLLTPLVIQTSSQGEDCIFPEDVIDFHHGALSVGLFSVCSMCLSDSHVATMALPCNCLAFLSSLTTRSGLFVCWVWVWVRVPGTEEEEEDQQRRWKTTVFGVMCLFGRRRRRHLPFPYPNG